MSEFLTSHRAIREALDAGQGGAVLWIATDSARLAELTDRAMKGHVEVRRVSRKEVRARAPDAHDAALELARAPRRPVSSLEEAFERADRDHGLLLVLDHITDPHNYGAVLRSADQFGVDAVVVPGRRAAPLSAVAVQSSAGTAHHVSIITVTNLAKAVASMQEAGFWVYAAEMSGEPAHRVRLTGRTALVMGSEGKGVSRLVAERADGLIRIPTGGHADSLNVSVASGILLYEIRRQQGWLAGR